MIDWNGIVSKNLPHAVRLLQTYCQQPSIAAQGVGIQETVALVTEMIQGVGGHVEVLSDCGGNPVIYAVFEPGPKGNPERTLLFYNHYDVQPAEPLDEWSFPPFGGEIKDGKIYGRGVADNKGDLIVRLQAIALLQANGGLPCRVKFLIEGEEEVGSPSLEAYLEKYGHLFTADGCIWEFGGKNFDEQVEMVAGVKGMSYLQLTCETAEVDIHSSMAAIIETASWRLIQALASMRTPDHRIAVEGFYDDVAVPSQEVLESIERLPIKTEAMKALYGLRRPLRTKATNPNLPLLLEPTMTVCGFESGYTGSGVKTVLPKNAQAKLDCRLVPDQDPDDIYQKVRRHLDLHGYEDIQVERLNGDRAFRSDLKHPFIQTVVETAEVAYGTSVVMAPNSPGGGPMHLFSRYIDDTLPIVSTGCGWWNSRAHAPDESIRLADFEQATRHMVLLLEKFSEADAQQRH